jgi:hypothetical protein
MEFLGPDDCACGMRLYALSWHYRFRERETETTVPVRLRSTSRFPFDRSQTLQPLIIRLDKLSAGLHRESETQGSQSKARWWVVLPHPSPRARRVLCRASRLHSEPAVLLHCLIPTGLSVSCKGTTRSRTAYIPERNRETGGPPFRGLSVSCKCTTRSRTAYIPERNRETGGPPFRGNLNTAGKKIRFGVPTPPAA